jgi:hypothetical protein
VLRKKVTVPFFAAALVSCVACGKKGPPLAPLRLAPAVIKDLQARRSAESVRLSFTAPAANDDGSTPVDLGRVDVYAVTVAKADEAPAGDEFFKQAKVVATADKVAPGEPAAVVEKVETQPAPSPVRIYVAVPVSARGRRGQPSQHAVVSLAAPPPPVGALRATHDAKAITLEWLPAVPDAAGYNVYEIARPKDPAADPAAAKPPAPVSAAPLNAAPLKAPKFADERVAFGVERCYAVSAVAGIEGGTIESERSEPACITPRDTFPPPAPANLAVVPGPGAISLIWDAVSAPDLGGYLVLRGEAPGERLAALTPAPIRETTYRDDSVKPGVRYVYVVVAVDTATPANVSAQSARVEEVAR